MTDSSPQTPPAQLLANDEVLAFTPVPLDRHRSNGWTPAQQERFIRALDVIGSARTAPMGMPKNHRIGVTYVTYVTLSAQIAPKARRTPHHQ